MHLLRVEHGHADQITVLSGVCTPGCYGVTCQYVSPALVSAGCSGAMLRLSDHDCYPFLLTESVKGTGCRGSVAATIDHSVIRAFYKPHDK
jgi:hypothetical protein